MPRAALRMVLTVAPPDEISYDLIIYGMNWQMGATDQGFIEICNMLATRDIDPAHVEYSTDEYGALCRIERPSSGPALLPMVDYRALKTGERIWDHDRDNIAKARAEKGPDRWSKPQETRGVII